MILGRGIFVSSVEDLGFTWDQLSVQMNDTDFFHQTPNSLPSLSLTCGVVVDVGSNADFKRMSKKEKDKLMLKIEGLKQFVRI